MKIFFSLLSLLFLAVSVNAITINGVVKDADTKTALPYATIVLQKESTGVITDDVGQFSIDVKKLTDTLLISYLGYTAIKKIAKEVQKNPICFLKPYTFEIAEVEITPLDIEKILRKTYDDFYKNHVHRNTATKSYYREQFFEGNTCVRYGEAVFDTRFYEEDGEDMSVLEPHLARSVEDSSFLKSFNDIFNNRRMLIPLGIDNYFENGVAESVSMERYHKSMGEMFFDKKNNGFTIDYKLASNYNLNGRENYFIKFEIYKRRTHIATGHFLIDKETYGIAAFEVQFREQENLTRSLIPARFRLLMKLFGFAVEIQDYEAKLNNRYEDGKWYIGNGIQILKGGIAKRGDWFKGKVVNEFHSFYNTDYKEEKNKKDKIFKDQRTTDFSSDFWGNYPFVSIQPKQKEYIERINQVNADFSGKVLSKRVIKKIAAKKAKEDKD